MNQHYDQARRLADRIKKISGVSKVILYGSVAREEARANSDIDLAVVLDNDLRSFSSGFSEFPEIEELRIREIDLEEQKVSGIKNHIVLYWEDEYERGVVLDTGCRNRADVLNKVGRTLFERQEVTSQ